MAVRLGLSTFVGRDLDADKDGTISAGELAAFAKNQIDALAEHSYFTTVTTPAGGFDFGPPESYAVEKLGDGRLRLQLHHSSQDRGLRSISS